jgi:GTPase
MSFVDELKIYMKAGDGGNGVVRWLREKGRAMGGPAGGDGGKGGDVYVTGIRDVNILAKYSHNPEFLAERGQDGMSKSMEGKNGEDIEVKLPLGSILKNLETGKEIEILNTEEKILVLKGGRGGYGNEHFKSSTNINPFESTKGKVGEDGHFFVELRLIADAGFIGLPSSGKSSLLNALTNAKSKVGAYDFTTLEPHLGDFYGFILADIPGLIEGASVGKGLGHKFLRHISRTKFLFHLISMESDTPKKDYETIRNELQKYSPLLTSKDEVIILSKTDMADSKKIEKVKKEFIKLGKKVLEVTILDDNSIKNLSDNIVKILKS